MFRPVLPALLAALLCTAPALAGPQGRILVVDADTFDIGGTRVRLFGIDAPEAAQTCSRKSDGKLWRCGDWATRAATRAFSGKTARCRKLDTDRYGRAVAACTVGGRDMGLTLIQMGAARTYTISTQAYVDAEKAAIVTQNGIYSSTMQSPGAFRASRKGASPHSAPGACRIKGNISKSGRIYHLPGQEHYDKTRISRTRGERWFCTEAEARAAGWRKARR